VYTFRLGYRPPYNWASIIGFLAPRAIPGVETITPEEYRRTISLEGHAGAIAVTHRPEHRALELRIEFPEPALLFRIVERVRNIFDLRADLRKWTATWRAIRCSKPPSAPAQAFACRGAGADSRSPCAAILGQQVSVKAATTMAGRIVSEFGSKSIFPEADALADADLARIGLTKQRAHSIRELAKAVAGGELTFDASRGLEHFEETIVKLPGIGPWTAQYVGMRIGEPDAFPSGDLYLKQFAASQEAWRPWRAYAAMYIWSMS